MRRSGSRFPERACLRNGVHRCRRVELLRDLSLLVELRGHLLLLSGLLCLYSLSSIKDLDVGEAVELIEVDHKLVTNLGSRPRQDCVSALERSNVLTG